MNFAKITDFTDNLVYNLRSICYKIRSKANRSGRLMFLHGSRSTWTRTGGRRNVRFNCRGMCTDLILVVTQSDFSSVKEEKRVCLVALVKNKTLPFYITGWFAVMDHGIRAYPVEKSLLDGETETNIYHFGPRTSREEEWRYRSFMLFR